MCPFIWYDQEWPLVLLFNFLIFLTWLVRQCICCHVQEMDYFCTLIGGQTVGNSTWKLSRAQTGSRGLWTSAEAPLQVTAIYFNFSVLGEAYQFFYTLWKQPWTSPWSPPPSILYIMLRISGVNYTTQNSRKPAIYILTQWFDPLPPRRRNV